jgi:hypothetical protein
MGFIIIEENDTKAMNATKVTRNEKARKLESEKNEESQDLSSIN